MEMKNFPTHPHKRETASVAVRATLLVLVLAIVLAALALPAAGQAATPAGAHRSRPLASPTWATPRRPSTAM